MTGFTSQALLSTSLLLLAACGDDGTAPPPDGGSDEDAGLPMDGGGLDGFVPSDAGGLDSGRADATVALTINGTVFGEGASDRLPEAGVELWDGGAPDGAVITPGGRVIGATVALKDLEGAVISTTTTDELGAYRLEGPAESLAFLHVEPVEGYAGAIRAERTREADYTAFDTVLADEAGLDERASQAGITRDATLGWIACGFNPVDDMAGGEGAELGGDATSDPPFNITDVGVILDNRLAPLCQGDGSNPPGALPGATCTMDERAKQIFFPNVSDPFAPITPLDPLSGTCSLRFPITGWLTAPGSMTVVNIDCAE